MLPPVLPRASESQNATGTISPLPSGLTPKSAFKKTGPLHYTQRVLHKPGSTTQIHVKGDGELLQLASLEDGMPLKGALPTLRTVVGTGDRLSSQQKGLRGDLKAMAAYEASASTALKLTTSHATFVKAANDGLHEVNDLLRQKKEALMRELEALEAEIAKPGPMELQSTLGWAETTLNAGASSSRYPAPSSLSATRRSSIVVARPRQPAQTSSPKRAKDRAAAPAPPALALDPDCELEAGSGGALQPKTPHVISLLEGQVPSKGGEAEEGAGGAQPSEDLPPADKAAGGEAQGAEAAEGGTSTSGDASATDSAAPMAAATVLDSSAIAGSPNVLPPIPSPRNALHLSAQQNSSSPFTSSPHRAKSGGSTMGPNGLYKFPIRHDNVPGDKGEAEARILEMVTLRDKLKAAFEEAVDHLVASREDLKERFSAASASLLAQKSRIPGLTAAKVEAEKRLRTLQCSHLHMQNQDLTMSLTDDTRGSCSRTKAMIEAALQDRSRQGRASMGTSTSGATASGRSGGTTGISSQRLAARSFLGITSGHAVMATSNGSPSNSPREASSPKLGSPKVSLAPLKNLNRSMSSPIHEDGQKKLELMDMSNFEQLAPIKRLMLLQQMSSRFSHLGYLAAQMHMLMSSTAKLHDLDNPLASLKHLVDLTLKSVQAEQVLIYKIHGGQYWRVAPDQAAVTRPVERGVVSFAAQTATLLQTDELRKCFAYCHDYEDVQVPNNPPTPAIIMPVRNPAASTFPVPGVIPSKVVVKAIGKKKKGPAASGGQSHPTYSAADVQTMRMLCGLSACAMDNWDEYDCAKSLVARYTQLLEGSRLLMHTLDHKQLLYELANAAADAAEAEAGVLYLFDRSHNELVGHMVTKKGEQLCFRTSSNGMLGQVLMGEHVQSFLNVRSNANFIPSIDGPPQVPISSMVVAPIKGGPMGKATGLIQVINKRVSMASSLYPSGVRTSAFGGQDTALVACIASMATSSCYFADHVRALMQKQSGGSDHQADTLADGARKLASVMRDQLQCENVRLFLVEPQHKLLYLPSENCHFPMNVGIVGQVAATGHFHTFTGSRVSAAEQRTKERSDEFGLGLGPTDEHHPGHGSLGHHFKPAPAEAAARPPPLPGVAQHGMRGFSAAAAAAEEKVVEATEDQYDEYVDGAGRSPLSTMALPLKDATSLQVFAVLTAVNKRQGRFSQSDIDTLKSFGSLASIVIMHSRSHQKVDHCHSLASGMEALAERMAMTFDYKTLGTTVEGSIKSMLGVSMCALLLAMTSEELDTMMQEEPSGARLSLKSSPKVMNRRGSVLMLPSVLAALAAADGNTPADPPPTAAKTSTPACLYCCAESASDAFGRLDLSEKAEPVVLSLQSKLIQEGDRERDEYTGKVHPLHMTLTVPLKALHTNKCVGVIMVERKGFEPFSAEEQMLLEAVAARVVVKLESGRMQGARQSGCFEIDCSEEGSNLGDEPSSAAYQGGEDEGISPIAEEGYEGGLAPEVSHAPNGYAGDDLGGTDDGIPPAAEEGEEGGFAQEVSPAQIEDVAPDISEGAVDVADGGEAASAGVGDNVTMGSIDIGEGGEDSRPVTASFAVMDRPPSSGL